MLTRTALAALLLMAGPAASAASSTHIDGHALAEMCADGSAYFNYGRCAGFILAAHDAAVLGQVAICVEPQDITSEVMITPVIAHLAAPAIDLSQPAVVLVEEALAAAFACEDAS